MTSTPLQSNVHTAVAPPAPSAHQRSDLGIFCQALVGLTPVGEYHDKALANSLNQQLAAPERQIAIAHQLAAIPVSHWPDSNLHIDPSTAMALASRAEYLRRMAIHLVNPDGARWLNTAIEDATAAPGMRALSLAISLGAEHSRLSFESLIALAAIVLMPVLHASVALDESLPNAKSLDAKVPRLDTWSTVRDVGYLLQRSGMALLCEPESQGSVLRFSPHATWHALCQTAQFKSVFKPLLSYMDWFGGRSGEHTSPLVTQALAGRVIADHVAAAVQLDGEPLEKALRRRWVCEHSHVQIYDKVRKLVRAHFPQALPSTLDIMCHLFLREAMPELLVEGVPDHLQYGRSLQSVAFIHGVALVEALSPGLSQITPYDTLIKVSADLAQSSDVDIHALWAKTLIIPALRYATAHGAIEWKNNDDVHQASAAQISQALAYLDAQQSLHAQELNSLLGIKPADRKGLAQQMLKAAGVDHWLWEQSIHIDHWPILQAHGFTVASSYSIDRLLAAGRPQASVVELVMMGEVYIQGQPTVPEAYATAFDAFQRALVSAEASIIRRQLSEMQVIDQKTLLDSTCELSRVRFGAQEGTQGLFIRCQAGDHRSDFEGRSVGERFFELIPAAGVAGEVRQAFRYAVEGVTWSGTIPITEALSRKEAHQRRIEKARVTPLWPMDSDAYLLGAVSRSSAALHQPQQGTLIPSATLVYFADTDQQSGLDILASKAAEHLLGDFLERSKAEHLHETQWEQVWAKEREYADIAARLIIPFYGCIKDLASGDRSGGAIAGCVMDVAFVLLPLGQFASSTARIVLRAGEMSVESVARLTGKAVGKLIAGLAKSSAVFALRDIGRLGLKMGVRGWAALLEDVPSLSRVFSSQAVLDATFGLDKGMYRLAEDVQLPITAEPASKIVMVDGRADVVVRDVGTLEQPDFRLSDPRSGAAFGKKLTQVAQSERMEFSVFSAQERISPEHYPPIAPVTEVEYGTACEVRIVERYNVRAIEREGGVFDILVDDQIYHIDANTPDAALRKLAVEKLSLRSTQLQETERLCRVRRNLIEIPCTNGVKLATPAPEPIMDGSTSPKRTGKYPSNAMDAREFGLDRLSLGADSAASSIDVFVNEGKFCKWADSVEPVASTSAAVKQVVPLSEAERALLALPETPVYLPQLRGALARAGLLGLPENFPMDDALWIYAHIPVIKIGPIASDIADARALRGIRLEMDGENWIFIEPDTGLFYKAPISMDEAPDLKFSRVTEAAEINEYIRVSEQYRLVREFPGAEQDQENIARLLFDLLDDSARADWHVSWGEPVTHYDDYVQWCTANQKPNDLLKFAANIMSGEEIQKKFVTLARNSIPDFKKITLRSLPDQQHIVEVLNQLLPTQGSPIKWEKLTLESIVTPQAPKRIMKQVRGANLSFLQAYTESGERVVYYALSGGNKAKDLKLQLDVTESTERVIDGVIYRDARARMAGRQPDPGFTSLPVIRDVDHLVVRSFGRYLDSERLIATVLKEDMASTKLTHIKVFTVLDTCRSCGGFVLPRLKLDFPDAQFSVTYLKPYQAI
ncbi:deaminase domain-containing protein [Pseudomonas viridiflava]|uniref:deaminase domain-containing protein n=1 Tax=Pseudomonas viridiflava TaxID=33069 RepID=UPI000F0642A7|nr:deaminase domain-containing protein [Pseudomonas viridiflava]